MEIRIEARFSENKGCMVLLDHLCTVFSIVQQKSCACFIYGKSETSSKTAKDTGCDSNPLAKLVLMRVRRGRGLKKELIVLRAARSCRKSRVRGRGFPLPSRRRFWQSCVRIRPGGRVNPRKSHGCQYPPLRPSPYPGRRPRGDRPRCPPPKSCDRIATRAYGFYEDAIGGRRDSP